MKRILCCMMAAALLLSMACKKPDGSQHNTSSEPKSEQSSAPNETEKTDMTVYFYNGLENTAVERLHITSAEEQSWNDPLNENRIAMDTQISVDGNLFSLADGGQYDIGVIDENGVNYDAYNVDLKAGDTIALVGGIEDATYNIEHKDKTIDIIAAVMSKPDEENHENAELLCVGVLRDAGYAVFEGTDRISATYLRCDPMLSTDYEVNYPELAEELKRFNADRAAAMNNEFKAFYSETQANFAPEQSSRQPNFDEKCFIRRADSLILSVLFERKASKRGGEEFSYSSACFDPKTGNRLTVSDVVEDTSVLTELLNKQLQLLDDDRAVLRDEDVIAAYEGFSNDLAWSVEPYGITFVFNKNAFGMGNDQACSVQLSFEENPDLIKKKYACSSENYTVAFPFSLPLAINGGDMVKLVPNGNDQVDYSGIEICLNDAKLEQELFAYELDAIYVHKGDKELIYLNVTEEDGYTYFDVFELAGGEPKHVKSFASSWYYEQRTIDGEYLFIEYMPIDTESFIMSTYTDIFGTYNGLKTYKLGDDGLPASDDKYYIIIGSVNFTVTKSITLPIVDELGRATNETVTIEKGSVVAYLRTDAETCADILLEDGRIARVVLDRGEDGKTLPSYKGVNIIELFDGLIYAD